jgi:hypothetical protein
VSDFSTEHEGPLRPSATVLCHRDINSCHLGTQQVLPMARASFPAAHDVAERFRGDLRTLTGARGASLHGLRTIGLIVTDAAAPRLYL